jgi:hypothetical protein
MGTDRINRQFLMLDFDDLDSPEFMSFVRSPEFSTYLVMRRYIWRSDKPHTMGLHEYYARGLLACSLDREKIAESLGGITPVSISKDITALIKRGIIQAVRTGRQSIYILGKWAVDPEDKVYYEYYFLDRLYIRDKESFTSDVVPDATSSFVDIRDKVFFTSDIKETLPINRESNIEANRETSNLSKEPPDIPPSSSTGSEEIEVLASSELESLIETCSREFDDMTHLESNQTHAFNLWAKTRFDEAEMLVRTRQARETTKLRIGSSAVKNRQKKMAYFFAVLEDVLGLKQAKS